MTVFREIEYVYTYDSVVLLLSDMFPSEKKLFIKDLRRHVTRYILNFVGHGRYIDTEHENTKES